MCLHPRCMHSPAWTHERAPSATDGTSARLTHGRAPSATDGSSCLPTAPGPGPCELPSLSWKVAVTAPRAPGPRQRRTLPPKAAGPSSAPHAGGPRRRNPLSGARHGGGLEFRREPSLDTGRRPAGLWPCVSTPRGCSPTSAGSSSRGAGAGPGPRAFRAGDAALECHIGAPAAALQCLEGL